MIILFFSIGGTETFKRLFTSLLPFAQIGLTGRQFLFHPFIPSHSTAGRILYKLDEIIMQQIYLKSPLN